MKLVKIIEKEFDYFYSLLEQDFCYEERKTKDDELFALKNFHNFNPCFIYEEDEIIGYFTYWDFEEFIFGEHFAILKELRNHKKGTNFLGEFLGQLTKPFIFEVERSFDETSKRRINFYERNGIKINDFDYCQPSYHGGDDKVPMHIASYPNYISEGEYLKYTKIIKDNVYLIKEK